MSEQETDPSRQPTPLEYRSAEALPGWRRRWVGLFWVAGILAGCALLAAILFLSRSRGNGCTVEMECSSNLKNIAAGCIIYANTHNGAYPASFEELLLSSGMPAQEFICPASNDTCINGTPQQQAASFSTPGHLSYVYLGKNLTSTSPEDAVLAYEPLANHRNQGMNVLFNDYHVQWLPAAEARKLMNSIRPGEPTVWPPHPGK